MSLPPPGIGDRNAVILLGRTDVLFGDLDDLVKGVHGKWQENAFMKPDPVLGSGIIFYDVCNRWLAKAVKLKDKYPTTKIYVLDYNRFEGLSDDVYHVAKVNAAMTPDDEWSPRELASTSYAEPL